MSQFKKDERVQIAAEKSHYYEQYGTVIEVDTNSVRLILDGEKRPSRFLDGELVSAPYVPAPGKELTRTLAYIRELGEDAKLMLDASDLLPSGSSVQRDLRDFAGRQSKIVYTLKMLLDQDGVKLGEDEDGVE